MELKQIVIESIKIYRQGTKTVHELFQELKGEQDLEPLSDTSELPHEIMSRVGLGAFNSEELFELPDAVATRPGLIHLLQEYLADRLTVKEINDWGENHIVWEVGRETDDETVNFVAGNIIAVSDIEPEKYFTKDIVDKIIRILQAGSNSRAKEKIAIHLAFPETYRSFYYYTAQYKQGDRDKHEYEKYLANKLGITADEFPYWSEIDVCQPTLEAAKELASKMLLMT